jgi:hypothetical protein
VEENVEQPLKWPKDAALEPSKLVRILMWIPVLGWWIGAILDQHRLAPVRTSICSQLAARAPILPERWGSHRVLASRVCRRIREWMEWPNDHFIPDDPMEVILSAGRDGLDAEEAILDAAKDAGVKLSKEQRNRVYDLTLGEFIHRLAEGVAPC